jgi:hypothetical protein
VTGANDSSGALPPGRGGAEIRTAALHAPGPPAPLTGGGHPARRRIRARFTTAQGNHHSASTWASPGNGHTPGRF